MATEAPVSGPFERYPADQPDARQDRNVKRFVVVLLLAVLLIGYAISRPGTARWVAESVEAEFVHAALVPFEKRTAGHP